MSLRLSALSIGNAHSGLVCTAQGTPFGRMRRCPLGQSQLGQLPGEWLPCGQGTRSPLSPRQGLRASATASCSFSDGGEEQVKVLDKTHSINGREVHGHEHNQLSNRNVERLHAIPQKSEGRRHSYKEHEPRLCMSGFMSEARAPGTCLWGRLKQEAQVSPTLLSARLLGFPLMLEDHSLRELKPSSQFRYF